MKRYKPFIPVSIFTLGFILAFIMMANHQWLYGGYEGLLFHSLENILIKEAVTIEGQLTMSPSDEDPLGSIMTMDFLFKGTYDRENESGKIIIELASPEGGDAIPVAELVKDKTLLMLLPEKGQGEPVDLSELIVDYEEVDPEEFWHLFYDKVIVTEVALIDKRAGKGHLPRALVQYELDLLTLLSPEEVEAIKQSLGLPKTDTPVKVTLLVDHGGSLSSITLGTSLGPMVIDGWWTVR